MNRIALVTVAYDRVESLKRLLRSLEQAEYFGEHPTLIISIDKSNSDQVECFADEYIWPYGEKIVRKHEHNLGLKNHMMSLGEWFNKFETLVVLEDDIIVSPCFYPYVHQASNKYMGSSEICGISLYGFSRNYQTRLPFTPMSSEYDGFFMNCAMSWGEVWMKPQWLEFYEWYLTHQEFHYEPHLPEVICHWDKSWLKYHTRFCIENNKYFLYPYVSLSTNYTDVGEHAGDEQHSWGFQVPLQYGKKSSYNFPDSVDEAVQYDGFFENKALYQALELSDSELCLDLCGTRVNKEKKRYWLTTAKTNLPIVKSFAMNSRPIEMSIINKEYGHEIFLYDTGCNEGKADTNSIRILFAYNIEQISVFIHQYGFINFVVDSIKFLIRR